ncbi:NAD(P)/FAD-dependent oxidoreductase [Halosimplex sp. J119]
MNAEYDIVVVGGGVAGLTAGLFTARNGLRSAVIDAEESILRRNAHLENFPGFPAGVNPRQLLELMRAQARDPGCEHHTGTVKIVTRDGEGFAVETADGRRFHAEYVVAATKNATEYLDGLDCVEIVDRGKPYVGTDERGRTDVDGLYAAGRLAGKPHQAIVCAGHGAEVAVTVLEDDGRPFYHDWVTPSGYFTDRGREVPPGCEEIDEGERQRREARALATMRERFAEPHSGEQVTHPTLRDD